MLKVDKNALRALASTPTSPAPVKRGRGVNRRVAIAGVALSDVGSVPTATPYGLIAQAARRALHDAGLTRRDIDGLGSTSTAPCRRSRSPSTWA